jgi:hypothetical protein
MVGSRGMTGTLFGLIGTIPSALADQNPYYRRLVIAAALAVTMIMNIGNYGKVQTTVLAVLYQRTVPVLQLKSVRNSQRILQL